MRATVATFLLALGFFTTVASAGFFLNDEMELGASGYNLYRGRLTVDEVPDEYYKGGFIVFIPRVASIDGHGYIAESRAAAVMSLPFYPLVAAAGALGSPQLLFAGVAAVGLFGGAAVVAQPSWRSWSPRARRATLVAGGLALGAFLGANAALARPIPVPLWGPPLAMQLATLVLTAAGVAAFHRFVALRTGDRWTAGIAAAVLAGGTTLWLWSFGQKYHAPNVALVAFVLLLRFAAPPTLRRRAAAYACAGLAVWVQVKSGGILLLALLATDALVALSRLAVRSRGAASRRDAARATAAVALGLVLGLAPYAAENALLFGDPLVPGYAAVPALAARAAADEAGVEPARGGAPSSAALVGTGVQQAVSKSVHERMVDVPAALYAVFVSPDPVHTQLQYGLLMLAPLLALAPFGAWRLARDRRPGDLEAFLAVHAGLALFFYGVYALNAAGAGYEARYLVLLYPGLAWYAAVEMREGVRGHEREFLLVAAAAVPLCLLLAAFGLAARPFDYSVGLLFLRDVGLAVIALLLAARLVPPLLARRLPAVAAWAPRARAVAWSLGFVPPLWFLLQHGFLYPPRSLWAGVDDPPLVMLVPIADVLRQALQALLR